MESDYSATLESVRSWLKEADGLLQTESDEPHRWLQLRREGKLLFRRVVERSIDQTKDWQREIQIRIRQLQNRAESLLKNTEDETELQRCHEFLDLQLREDEAYLSDLLTQPNLENVTRGYLLQCFRWDLQWYATLLAILEHESPADPTVAAQIQLDAIRESLAPEGDKQLHAGAEVDKQVRRLDRELLCKRIEAETGRATATAHPTELWTRRLLLSRLQAQVEALARQPETIQDGVRDEVLQWSARLAEYRSRLADSATDSIKELDPRARHKVLQEIVLAADSDVKEIITLLEDLPIAEAVHTIELTHEDMRQVHLACKTLQAKRDWEPDERREVIQLTRRAKHLRSLTERIRVNKRVTQRMQSLFGKPVADFIDKLMLILVLAITFLFVEEIIFESMEFPLLALHDFEYFIWLDLIICSLLMSEFWLKFALADRKWHFLKDPQHWLAEFVASIPFAFIAHNAHHLVAFEGFLLLRLLRLARLPRLVRIGRLFLFAQRALDQLVRRHATIFNRNIVLFEPEEAEAPETRHRHLLYTLRERFSRRTGEVLSKLAPQERVQLAQLTVQDLETIIDHVPVGEGLVALAKTPQAREVQVDTLIRELIEMTPERLIEQMGQSFAVSVYRYIRMFDIAIIRRLPVVRQLIATSQKGAAEVAALAVNYAGHALQSLVNFILFLADLQGTISAPIFLDRLGTTLINATQRPAKRLIVLGVVVLTVTFMIWVFDIRQQERRNILRFAINDIEAVIIEPEHPLTGQSFPVVRLREVATVDSLELKLPSGETFIVPREWTDLADPPPSLIGSISNKLNKLLGWPVIVLGVVCLIPLFIGRWLRKIANQAAEQSERLVEAQFAAQTKALKAKNLKQDWRFLAERVIAPEFELRSCDDQLLANSCDLIDFRTIGTPAEVFSRNPEIIFLHNLELLYEDYLDGALFHRSDNKTTTQLLGNIALTNLRRRNLEHSLNDAKRLRSLDLGRSAGGLLGGPYLWFNYITRMITQETAKLLMDYNRHAIPLDQLASSPRYVRRRYQNWLAQRLKISPDQVPLPAPIGRFGDADIPAPSNRRNEAEGFFECVDFTAIDFLADDPRRLQEIEIKFGPLVAELVRRDRQLNVRRAFRSFPLHTVPLQMRTINLFQLYETYIANLRGLLLPFRVLRWAGAIVVLLIHRTIRLVREILHPQVIHEHDERLDTYSMAKRKIHRMRKPAYMESLWLRARIDIEYIGLPLPLVPLTLGNDSLIETDLEYIGATRRDRLASERLRQEQREKLLWIERWLRRFEWDFLSLPHYLHDNFPYLSSRAAEVLRAMVTACILDHDDIFTLGVSIEALELIREYTRDPSHKASTLPAGLPPTIDFRKPHWYQLRYDKKQADKLLQLPMFADCDEGHRHRLERCLRKNRLSTQGWVAVLVSQGGDDPWETVRGRLLDVMRRTDLWSNEILALRTIQTLTMLDVHHYGEMVWRLGGYHEIEDRDLTSGLPLQTALPKRPESSVNSAPQRRTTSQTKSLRA